MAEQAVASARAYRRLADVAAVLAFGLIALGGVVRISGSGLGCGAHWPRCNGQWFPPLDLPTLIEISHRWIAATLSLAVIALAVVAWRHHRENHRLRAPATLALLLLVIQVLLGPVIVKLDLPPVVVVVHLLNAMVLLAVLVVASLRAGRLDGWTVGRLDGLKQEPAIQTPNRLTAQPPNRLVHATAAVGFAVLLFGALTANLHAGLMCQGFPLCEGRLGPPITTLGLVQWTHRILAFTFLGLVVVLVRKASMNPGATRLRRAAFGLLIATLFQIAVAAAMVLNLLPPWLRAAHLVAGTLVWVALVVVVYMARHGSIATLASAHVKDDPSVAPPGAGRPSLIADLITLTKPRIISLLLVTTVAPMFITPRGLPSPALVFWVVIGGYLMAGGANTINMWFDRDIDDLMTRTRLRPLPSGRMRASAALAFGVGLAASAFAIFWWFVNPLSAWLALGGLLFYVFIYTIWLKRISPQNIVIGGAAGAFPPLVGWAAMTGSLDLAAVYLFAIIFYWTPPHFWALALIKQSEYAKAGVPMMPVVRGEQQTKMQMLAYTLMLLPLTIMPSVFGALGIFYGVAAVLLGARLLWYAVKLLREQTVTPTAWAMYQYSLIYLFLLFIAMGVDRAVPFGHARQQRPEILILSQPDQGKP